MSSLRSFTRGALVASSVLFAAILLLQDTMFKMDSSIRDERSLDIGINTDESSQSNDPYRGRLMKRRHLQGLKRSDYSGDDNMYDGGVTSKHSTLSKASRESTTLPKIDMVSSENTQENGIQSVKPTHESNSKKSQLEMLTDSEHIDKSSNGIMKHKKYEDRTATNRSLSYQRNGETDVKTQASGTLTDNGSTEGGDPVNYTADNVNNNNGIRLSHKAQGINKTQLDTGNYVSDKSLASASQNNRMILSQIPQTRSERNRTLTSESDQPLVMDGDLSVRKGDLAHIQVVPGSETFIYSVFLDKRFKSSYIRVFAIQNRIERKTQRLDCRVQLQNGTFLKLHPETDYPIYPVWPSEKLIYQSYFYSFNVPLDVTEYLSKSQSRILFFYIDKNPNKTLSMEYRIVNIPPENAPDVALCVRATWGELDVMRLIEWFEFNQLLGVSKFIFYTRALSYDSLRVLLHYEREDILEIVRAEFNDYLWDNFIQFDPIAQKLITPEWLMEQVYILNTNDCVYRYASSYKNIIILDLDELIVPTKVTDDLGSVVKQLLEQYPYGAAFTIAAAWHFDEFGPISMDTTLDKKQTSIVDYKHAFSSESDRLSHVKHNPNKLFLHTLEYVKRTPIMRSQPKSIIISSRAVTVNMHSVISVQNETGYSCNFYIEDGQLCMLHHYRYKCKYEPDVCEELIRAPVVDDVIPRYASELYRRVRLVIGELID